MANLDATKAPATEPAAKLALDGGAKAVTQKCSLGLRWGEPERERLNAMLQQQDLFYWKGPQTTLMLERFKQVCPVKYAQSCSSGTAALHIAVLAAGIGPGDEVITSPITDIGTVIGVLYQQAVPVFADLGASTYNLDPADVERRITPKTKAIIAVHLCGNPCDLQALKAIADKHKLVLIEDSCQAWGAKFRGRPIGTIGDMTCFSLQNTKQITCGDGGLVGSSDERFGPLLQKFGDKGFDRIKGGGFQAFSTNYRMSEPQAAVVAGQLTRLEAIAAKRARLGNLLTEKISGLPGVMPHQVHPEDRCVYWFYFFRIKPEAFHCDRGTVGQGAGGRRGTLHGRLYRGAAARASRCSSSTASSRATGLWRVRPDHDGLHEAPDARGRGHPEDRYPRDDPRRHDRRVHPQRGRSYPQSSPALRRVTME